MPVNKNRITGYWFLCLCLGVLCFESPLYVSAQSRLDYFNVIWTEPGPGSAESMPLGNGDIGLNAWVEPGGDILFYVSKTDAWGDQVKPGMDGWMKQGGILSKLGLVRVSFGSGTDAGSRLVAGFRQVLRLQDGEIRITEGDTHFRLWVDANHPVIRVEMESSKPVLVKVSLEDWRLGEDGDSVVKEGMDRISWYHRNKSRGPGLQDSALADITFGGVIHGPGLVRNGLTLVSGKAVKGQTISVDALTAKTGRVVNGKVVDLVVLPASRAGDVKILTYE